MCLEKFASALTGGLDFIHDRELLCRPPLPANEALMARAVEGKSVLVTGAAGSIGSELSRTIARLKPSKLVLLDLSEAGLFEILRELGGAASFPVIAALGSVTEGDFLRETLRRHGVQTVYHCAAFKHVALVEANCVQAVRNNVLGTWELCEAALQSGVATLVHVSSDKAASPAGVMGATKLWSERVVHHFAVEGAARESTAVLASVRLGNVLGSSGSVVPIFREQIARGRPLTLTHVEATRYFMTAREAAETIVQAGALAEGGDLLIPDLGPPQRIADIAEKLAAQAGLRLRTDACPDGEVELTITGMAPGEKLHERQVEDGRKLVATAETHVWRVRGDAMAIDMRETTMRFRTLLTARDDAGVRRLLFGGTA